MSVNHAAGFVKHQDRTRDAFLGGKLSIEQPANGFRAGTDSVLLGVAVSPRSRTVLDLGAGAGVAALSAMAHNTALHATLIDIDSTALAFARANARANGLAERIRCLELDAGARGAMRIGAGLQTDAFDTVIANPPYFLSGAGTRASDAGRARARQMEGGAIEAWVRTAVSSATARGEIIFIHSAEALPELLASFKPRLGGISILPLAARPGRAASRVLVRGEKGSRAPLRLLAPLVLHAETGSGFAPEADAIFRGASVLDWRSGT